LQVHPFDVNTGVPTSLFDPLLLLLVLLVLLVLLLVLLVLLVLGALLP
jgi:hypothetical protein